MKSVRARILLGILVASLVVVGYLLIPIRSDPPRPGDNYTVVFEAFEQSGDARRCYRRFAALADKGDPLALKWVLDRAAYYQGPDEEEDLGRYLEAVVQGHAQDPRFISVARRMHIFGHWAGAQRVCAIGMRWRAQGAHAGAMPGLLESLSELLLPLERGEEARQCLEELVRDYPASKEAPKARGTLFRLTMLKPGMAGPDFEAVDVDGESFRLSDYRGQVVLLDFWGFW